MPYFAIFGTLQCLILQFSELFNALFYRHRERLASGRCKQRSGNPEPRERSGNALFCILWPFIEAVNEVRHYIAGQGVAVCFGAALRVDDLRDIAKLIENIESVEGEGDARLGEGLAQACVPHEVVGVGGAVGIAAARVHGKVGAELERCGQIDERGEAVVEVI